METQEKAQEIIKLSRFGGVERLPEPIYKFIAQEGEKSMEY